MKLSNAEASTHTDTGSTDLLGQAHTHTQKLCILKIIKKKKEKKTRLLCLPSPVQMSSTITTDETVRFPSPLMRCGVPNGTAFNKYNSATATARKSLNHHSHAPCHSCVILAIETTVNERYIHNLD